MRRIHKPTDLQHTYQIFGPTGSKKSFRIKRIEPGKSMVSVKDDRLATINVQLKAGSISKAEAQTQVELLREALYRADGVKVSRVESNRENERLVEKYIQQVINKRKIKDVSKQTAAQGFRRAVRALGELSVMSEDIEILQEAFDEKYPDRRQRQLVTNLNSLLAWLGRKDRFKKHEKEDRDVKYIPFDKIDPVLQRLPNEAWQVAVQLALYSGLRIGELMALTPNCKLSSGVKVDWQINREGEKTKPKRGKRRKTAWFAQAASLFDRWMELKDQISHEERLRASRIIMSACRRAYPNKTEWHLCFHDLRHSYAVRCFEMGMSVEYVAKQLGNLVSVTEEHYITHTQTDDTMDAAFAIMNRKTQKTG